MKKSLLTLLVGLIVGCIIGWFSNKAHRGRDNPQYTAVTEVYRDTIIDTIPYYLPTQAAEQLLGYSTYTIPTSNILNGSAGGIARLRSTACAAIIEPTAIDSTDLAATDTTGYGSGGGGEPRPCGIASAEDSAAVSLPVIQRHYADSTYSAYVSGPIDPRLDSIVIYPRTIMIRERENKPPNRWGIGVVAGYGYTRHGFSPYLGAGVTYSIITF